MRTVLFGMLLIGFTVIFIGNTSPSGTSFVAYLCFFTSAIIFGFYLKISHRLDSTIIFFLIFTIFIAFGALFFSRYPDMLLQRFSSGEQLLRELDRYALYMALAILLFISVSLILKLGPSQLRIGPMPTPPNYRPVAWMAFSLIYLICLLGLIAEPAYFGNIPKLFLGELTGGAIRKTITLTDSANSYPGKGFVLALKYQILPVIALITISLSQGNKRLLRITLILTILMLFSEFRRGPTLQFLLSVMFLSFLNGRRINASRMLYFGGLVLFLYLGLTIVLGHAKDLPMGEVAFELLWRIVFSQSQTGTYVFQIFPDMQPFSEGRGYLNAMPSILTGSDNRPLSVEVFYLVHGRQGGASFTSFAEAYANFSLFGVILLALLLPIFFTAQESRYARHKDNPLERAYYVFALFFIVAGIAVGSLIGPLINMLLARVLIRMIQFFTSLGRTGIRWDPSQSSLP